MEKDLTDLTDAVRTGAHARARRRTEEAVAAGESPQRILDAMVAAMDHVGEKFKNGEIFVPEMLLAARAMKEGMAILEPRLSQAGIKPEFTAVIGTVQGDLHDIGKNLVAMMWKGANFGVVDLGANVAPETFANAAKEHHAQIIGLSALLTTTMPMMKTTVDAVRQAGLSTVKIVIGGAPTTPEFARGIGADGYAPDAATAVDVARQLVNA